MTLNRSTPSLLIVALASTAIALPAQAAESSGKVVEAFEDKGDLFIRAGKTAGLTVGSEVEILGDTIGDTTERRVVGKAVVLEVWDSLARIRPDDQSRATSEVRVVRISSAQKPTEVSAASTATPTSGRHGAAFIDPLGLLLFGPTLGVELGDGHFGGSLYVRFFGFGLFSRALFLSPAETFSPGISGGVRARYYVEEGLQGLHLGFQAEYLVSRVINTEYLAIFNTHMLVPQFEGGYRLALGRVYLDGGIAGGYAVQVYRTATDLPGGHDAAALSGGDFSSVYGTLSLEAGFFF